MVYFRAQLDNDMIMMTNAKNTSNEIFHFLDRIKINWAYGKSFAIFKSKIFDFGNEIDDLSEKINSRFIYTRKLKNQLYALNNVWNIIEKKLNWVISSIESPDFYPIIKKMEFQPGLQQLNRLWIDLYFSGTEEEKEKAYTLNRFLIEIENFPIIYGETLSSHYDIIINEMYAFNSKIIYYQRLFSLSFFIVFMTLLFLLSFKFTKAISKPIISSVTSLIQFMGTAIDKIEGKQEDEIDLLSNSVKKLISHYTKLSKDVRKLAEGNIEGNVIPISDYDIVGNSLKEVNVYLKELAQMSKWIRDGNYGVKIKVKSSKDVLAQTFNIMSNVISEKITTLRDIFDAVEEGIIVIDEDLNIIEANDNFLKLIKAESLYNTESKLNFLDIFKNDQDFIKKSFKGIANKEYYSEIVTIHRKTLPVKIIARRLKKIEGQLNRLMLFVSNESLKMRFKREKEKLKAQAVLAELKALRAQINPHFLFNTLNTIVHFSDTKPDNAVIVAEKLGDLFRYSLSATEREMVKITEELEYIRKYMEIENMRFGPRLIVSYNIDHQLENEQMPPMFLQPIVENAIKYGEDENAIITLNISVKKINDEVLISISDKGILKTEPSTITKGQGTGLKNINQRLKTLYRRKLHFQKNIPNGLLVSMQIPV